ncbi:MAG: hypothetical protein L0387_03220 [Acidobacteria bacterium]|nr:hypothetical protein [Acidobacteriota bacterium]MCI0723610.1 hypothetical protein [Acidobacteriota bacterium]
MLAAVWNAAITSLSEKPAIEQAGFSRIQLEHFQVAAGLSKPHIAGVATKHNAHLREKGRTR